MTTGRSSRTPFKHWILNQHLGRICGVLSTRSPSVPARPEPFLIVDLCAGDGLSTPDHDCSARIIIRHGTWLTDRRFSVEAVFIEKDANTFGMLKANVAALDVADRIAMRFLNEDARDFILEPTCDKQAIFLNCDPNAISDMPVSRHLAEMLTPTTTMTMTLGCNVGGLKRLPLEKRMEWIQYVETMVGIMPDYHDALLVEVLGDRSQWAYFTRMPTVWIADSARAVRNAGRLMFDRGVEVASYRGDTAGFHDMLNRLMLTRKENS